MVTLCPACCVSPPIQALLHAGRPVWKGTRGASHLRQHSQHGHLVDCFALVLNDLALVALLEGDIHSPVHDPQLAGSHCPHCCRPGGAVQQRQLPKSTASSNRLAGCMTADERILQVDIPAGAMLSRQLAEAG